jgi:hypothetical protein
MHVISSTSAKPGKMEIVIDVQDADKCRTDHFPELSPRLFQLLPSLKHQKCHNGYGYSFRQEAEATELPHLLEHLALELQSLVRYHELLKGETTWDWRTEPRGRFHVEISYEQRELAVEAVSVAESIIERLGADPRAKVDLAAELARLRSVAGKAAKQ